MARPRRAVLVAGTRPEFVKLQPVAVALADRDVPISLVVSNQHRRADMRDVFINGLRWPCEVEYLDLTSNGDALALMADVFRALPEHVHDGDVVVVQGDTSTVLAAALVANKRRLTLGHVEAGLRSQDLRMPEEHNRRLCDHVSDVLFAPTDHDAQNLRAERCAGRIHVVGNTAIDAVRLNMPAGGATPSRTYILMTIHRQENLAEPSFIEALLAFVSGASVPCVFPIHPRTKDTLERAGQWDALASNPNLELCEPMDYRTFLLAMRGARVIVTDSGGIQEEATAPEIRTPVVVIRRSTERPAAVDGGFSTLAPACVSALRRSTEDLSWFSPAAMSPFGDGHAADAIADVISDVIV